MNLKKCIAVILASVMVAMSIPAECADVWAAEEPVQIAGDEDVILGGEIAEEVQPMVVEEIPDGDVIVSDADEQTEMYDITPLGDGVTVDEDEEYVKNIRIEKSVDEQKAYLKFDYVAGYRYSVILMESETGEEGTFSVYNAGVNDDICTDNGRAPVSGTCTQDVTSSVLYGEYIYAIVKIIGVGDEPGYVNEVDPTSGLISRSSNIFHIERDYDRPELYLYNVKWDEETGIVSWEYPVADPAYYFNGIDIGLSFTGTYPYNYYAYLNKADLPGVTSVNFRELYPDDPEISKKHDITSVRVYISSNNLMYSNSNMEYLNSDKTVDPEIARIGTDGKIYATNTSDRNADVTASLHYVGSDGKDRAVNNYGFSADLMAPGETGYMSAVEILMMYGSGTYYFSVTMADEDNNFIGIYRSPDFNYTVPATKLATPEITYGYSGNNIELRWDAVDGANTYYVIESSDEGTCSCEVSYPYYYIDTKDTDTYKVTVAAVPADITVTGISDPAVLTIEAPDDSLRIEANYSPLMEGQTKNLTAILKDGDKDKTVTDEVLWSSSDVGTATVDSKGVVKAAGSIRSGGINVTITAKYPATGATAQYGITVYKPVKGITFNDSSVKLHPGDTFNPRMTVNPSSAWFQNIDFISSNTDVVEVKGFSIVAKAVGKAVINAKITGMDGKSVTAKYSVTVTSDTNPVKVSKIKLYQTKVNTNVGSYCDIYATVLPSNADNTELEWSIKSGQDVISIEPNGMMLKVTGVKEGKAVVTVTNPDSKKSANCTVNVAKTVDKIDLTGPASMVVNKSVSLKAYPIDKSGSKIKNSNILWSIEKGGQYASIDAKGKLTAKNPGTVTVRVTSADYPSEGDPVSATIDISIVSPIKKLALKDAKPKVDNVLTEADTAGGFTGHVGYVEISTITPADATDQRITWTSSKPLVTLGVRSSDGTVTFASGTSVTIDHAKGETLAYMTDLTQNGKTVLTGVTNDGSKKKVKCTLTVGGK